jgi:hypothetical protein
MKSLTLLGFVAIAACAGGAPTAPVGREFVIAAGETTVISGTGLAITFVRVPEDGRCPMGAMCIWAGNAQVELIATQNGTPKTLSLNTTTSPQDGTVAQYDVKLTDLAPIPSIGSPIEQKDYRATLLIRLLPEVPLH